MQTETRKLKWIVTVLTVAIGLLCGFMVGMLLTEERFGLLLMMRYWVYVLCMIAAILLPILFMALGNVLPLLLKKRLAATWWNGRGRVKTDSGWKGCKHPKARAFTVFALPPDDLKPDGVETAIRLKRKRLWRGTIWAILSALVLPAVFIIYMAYSITGSLHWPIFIIPMLYLLSLLNLIAAGNVERNGIAGSLRQSRQWEQNRLWALTNLWADQRLHYPDKDVTWLNNVCLAALTNCDLGNALNLRAADMLLIDLLAFHRNKPCPAPLMRVVRYAAEHPNKVFDAGGEAVIPLLYHLIHGYAAGQNTRKRALQLFDAAVNLTSETDIGLYNIMQTEHIMHEANHAEDLANEKLVAPFVGYAYYTCFPQFYVVQQELNRQVSGKLRRRRKKQITKSNTPDIQPEGSDETLEVGTSEDDSTNDVELGETIDWADVDADNDESNEINGTDKEDT